METERIRGYDFARACDYVPGRPRQRMLATTPIPLLRETVEEDVEHLFVFDELPGVKHGRLALIDDVAGKVALQDVATAAALKGALARRYDWVDDRDRPAAVPRRLIEDMLAHPSPSWPRISTFVLTPYVKPNGEIERRGGYHETIWFEPVIGAAASMDADVTGVGAVLRAELDGNEAIGHVLDQVSGARHNRMPKRDDFERRPHVLAAALAALGAWTLAGRPLEARLGRTQAVLAHLQGSGHADATALAAAWLTRNGGAPLAAKEVAGLAQERHLFGAEFKGATQTNGIAFGTAGGRILMHLAAADLNGLRVEVLPCRRNGYRMHRLVGSNAGDHAVHATEGTTLVRIAGARGIAGIDDRVLVNLEIIAGVETGASFDQGVSLGMRIPRRRKMLQHLLRAAGQNPPEEVALPEILTLVGRTARVRLRRVGGELRVKDWLAPDSDSVASEANAEAGAPHSAPNPKGR